MTFLNNVNISKKLTVGFAVVVTVVAVMCAAVFASLMSIKSAVALNDQSAAQLELADDVLMSRVERQNAIRGLVASGDPSFLKIIEESEKAYEAAISQWEKLAPEDAKDIAAIKAAVAPIRAEEAELISAGQDPMRQAEAMMALGAKGRLSALREVLSANVKQETELLKQRTAGQSASQAFAVTLLAVGSLLSVVLSVIMGAVLSNAVAKPVSAMTNAMGRLASGDNDIEIPAVGRKDEVGRMAAAVQHFKDAAIEKVRLEGEASEQRRAAEAARQTNETERAANAAEQEKVVDGLAQGLERLAAGALTFRLNEEFAPHYEKLRSDFNRAMDIMQQTIREVAVNATAVRSGASEITQATDDLSRRTEQQAASLEETAAALDEITATVRKTAEGAAQSREAVGVAKADAERSGVVVRDAVSAMSEIEGSAKQIGQIISVIDEIAFQTNLLALNAGVEAARAGDAGRGFAVVASEVRALAQRSAEAAKEIKALISSSGAQVDRGVRLVTDTGKALDAIVERVASIDGLVSEIAQSAQEQSTGLGQVNTAVNQMDQVTQQNAAMVEEATAAAAQLKREAVELGQLVSKFEVGEAASQPTRPQRATATPRADAPALQRKLRAAVGGGSDWNEF